MWGSQGPLSEAGNFIRSIFPLSVTGALRDTTVSSAGRAYIQITFLPLSSLRCATWEPRGKQRHPDPLSVDWPPVSWLVLLATRPLFLRSVPCLCPSWQ